MLVVWAVNWVGHLVVNRSYILLPVLEYSGRKSSPPPPLPPLSSLARLGTILNYITIIKIPPDNVINFITINNTELGEGGGGDWISLTDITKAGKSAKTFVRECSLQ